VFTAAHLDIIYILIIS